MLYWLFKSIESEGFPPLFIYITSRSAFAFITAFLVTLIVARPIIRRLYKAGYRAVERSYGDINTAAKTGTPIMGGLIMMTAGFGAVLLWCNLTNAFVLTLLVAGFYFAGMGALDDVLKIKGGDSDKGLSRMAKYASQIGFGLVLAFFVILPSFSPLPESMQSAFYVPFYKHALLDLKWLYIPFIIVMIVYSANAVNFSDGMDGLAIVPCFFVFLVLGIFAYVMGNTVYSDYLLYPYIPGIGEIVVFSAAMGGAALGFLWFNAHPAEVFMGDTGSLFLGGILGTMSILLKQEVIFLIAGGIFVIEIASTAIQEWIGFSILKRRIFYRAPLHHTFAHRGIVESKIVTRFWIVSALLAVFALATLKIR